MNAGKLDSQTAKTLIKKVYQSFKEVSLPAR
jgi:hypothetical protein